MKSKQIATYVSYGASELKRSYRKNLLIGNFFAGLLVFLFVLMIPPMARIPDLFAESEPFNPFRSPEIQQYSANGNWVFVEEDDTAKIGDSTISIEKFVSPDEFVVFDTPPELLEAPGPRYPEKALKAGIQGAVWVKVLVDKEGIVRDAIIVKESGVNGGFEESALEAAKKRKYRPALQNQQPVAVWIAYKVVFSLDEE
jgi:TonB family protein